MAYTNYWFENGIFLRIQHIKSLINPEYISIADSLFIDIKT